MILNAKGVRNVHGVGRFSSIEAIDVDSMPWNVGSVPLGRSDWYISPPDESVIFIGDPRKDIVPMRGSKRGMAITEGSNLRKAYEYRVASLAGRKFAKSERRVAFVSSIKDLHFQSNVWECIQSAFVYGFNCAYFNLDRDLREGCHLNWDRIIRGGCQLFNIFGDHNKGMLAVNFVGLDDDKCEALKTLIDQFIYGERRAICLRKE